MTKALFVAYLTPPFAEVGSVRIAKFIKYLSKAGWDITLLTVDSKYYKNCNDSFVDDMQGAKTKRTSRIPFTLPGLREEGFYWAPVLFFYLFYQLTFNRPNVAYFCGGPFSHWFLAPLCRLFGVKYVLDFRDPWILNPYASKKVGLSGKLVNSLTACIEAFAVRFSTRVINVTEHATRLYESHYSQYPKEKFVTICNGFDQDDFSGVVPKQFTDCDIVYTGKFGSFRDPGPFFKVFKAYVEEKKLTPEHIRFVWVGKSEIHIEELINSLELEPYVSRTGFVTYKECLSYVAGARLCLLISGQHPYEPTTKIFDYMALGKNVVPVVNAKGFLTDLFEEINMRYYSNLELSLNDFRFESFFDNFDVDDEVNERFSRELLAKKLESSFGCL